MASGVDLFACGLAAALNLDDEGRSIARSYHEQVERRLPPFPSLDPVRELSMGRRIGIGWALTGGFMTLFGAVFLLGLAKFT